METDKIHRNFVRLTRFGAACYCNCNTNDAY